MTNVNLTDENWLQIVTFIQQYNIPVESVSEVFGVTRKDIQEHISLFKELDPCVSSKTISGAMSIDKTEATWVTASELRLLGVKIRGLGVRKVGRVLLPIASSLELVGGDIEKVVSKRYVIYNVPESVLWRLWSLRPAVAERSLRIGDDYFMELLMKRLVSHKSGFDRHWTELDLKSHMQDLIQCRVDTKESARFREEAVTIENNLISEYEGE